MLPAHLNLTEWRNWPERFGRVTSGTTYVPQIDGLRFLAIMQVVAYHAALRGQRAADPAALPSDGAFAWWPNGIAGVELFFFVSGYIIAFPFLQGRKPNLKAFYLRRLTRLEPPYILTVLLCGLAFWFFAGSLGPSPSQQSTSADLSIWQSVGASLLYLHGTIFHSSPAFNPPLWTLEIEIQFYLIAPAMLAAYLLICKRTVRLVVGVSLGMLALAAQVYLNPVSRWHYSLLAHLYPFILGIVMSDWAVGAKPFQAASKSSMDIALLAGIALFLGSSLFFYAADSAVSAAAVLCARACSIVLIYLGVAYGVRGRKIFGNRWIALVGGACYSIYLLHVPALQFLTKIILGPFDFTGQPVMATILVFVLIVPLVLVGSFAFYLLVERPCMKPGWPKALGNFVTGKRKSA